MVEAGHPVVTDYGQDLVGVVRVERQVVNILSASRCADRHIRKIGGDVGGRVGVVDAVYLGSIGNPVDRVVYPVGRIGTGGDDRRNVGSGGRRQIGEILPIVDGKVTHARIDRAILNIGIPPQILARRVVNYGFVIRINGKRIYKELAGRAGRIDKCGIGRTVKQTADAAGSVFVSRYAAVLRGIVHKIVAEIGGAPVAAAGVALAVAVGFGREYRRAVVLGSTHHPSIAALVRDADMVILGHVVAVVFVLPDHRLGGNVCGITQSAVVPRPYAVGIAGIEGQHVLVGMVVGIAGKSVVGAGVPAHPDGIDQCGIGIVPSPGRHRSESVGGAEQVGGADKHHICVIGLHGNQHIVIGLGIEIPGSPAEVGKIGCSIVEGTIRDIQ